jgi:hypothetical protein
MEQQFIRKFTMMSPSDMYILPASCILHPLIVVPDIEDAESASTNHYMVIAPRHGIRGCTGELAKFSNSSVAHETLGSVRKYVCEGGSQV